MKQIIMKFYQARKNSLSWSLRDVGTQLRLLPLAVMRRLATISRLLSSQGIKRLKQGGFHCLPVLWFSA